MKLTRRHRLVLVTVPDVRVARRVAKAVLEARAAACVNLLPGLESHYWWKGRVERSKELLLVMKTTVPKLAGLERIVHEHHPYDTPEFVVLGIGAGSERYLAWINASVGADT